MTGTLLNTATVIVGSVVGVALGSRLNPAFKELTVQAIGVATLAIGVLMCTTIESEVLMLVAIGSLITGGLMGEALRIEARLADLGAAAERRFSRGPSGRFQQAFVSTSLIFCVGPMTVLGCMQDGMGMGIALLTVKSILDGVTAAFYAAALGWGVMLSAVTVLVVQGAITLAATPFSNTEEYNPYVVGLTGVGGLMLLALGLRLLELKPIRVANFLPGLALAPLIVWVLELTGLARQ